MGESIWKTDVSLPRFPRIETDVQTKNLIIGGGLCGLLCAYFLDRAGADYLLVEGRQICGGVTQNTTAKITAQHGFIYDRLVRTFGRQRAAQYLRANMAALEAYRMLAKGIDCGFETADAYVYSRDRERLCRESAALAELGFEAPVVDTVPIPVPAEGAVKFPAQAQFHPLCFAAGIAKDLHIFEDSFVHYVEPGAAYVNGHKISAENIVIATHFPFINTHGLYFIKLYQQRSYVLGLEGAPLPDGMYIDGDGGGYSFRHFGDILLLGGGGHRTGKHGGGYGELRRFAHEHYPNAKERFAFATQDCMSLDGVPYIGRYARFAKGVYVASGFNKWGMTSSMAAAQLLSDLLCGRENEFEDLYSPMRSVWRSQLWKNIAETAGHLLLPVPRRCTHLGCALKWNRAEHSWDCACHGSRFDADGRVLENPAMKNAKLHAPKSQDAES